MPQESITTASLIVSIVSALIAIVSIIQAMRLRQQTKKETGKNLNIIRELIINSAPDPRTVRRLWEDYEKAGDWRAQVVRGADGSYHLNTNVKADVKIGV
jgi:hypothetical protein